MRWQLEHRSDSTVEKPPESAYRRGDPWPFPAYTVLWADEGGYRIEVEMIEEPAGSPMTVGLVVRQLAKLERDPEDPTDHLRFRRRRSRLAGEGRLPQASPSPLSTRDVRRLPLDRIVRSAEQVFTSWLSARRRAAETGEEVTWPTEADLAPLRRRPKVPTGRPRRGDLAFYTRIAELYRHFRAEGKQPTIEIAALMTDADAGLVRQWIYRARDLGLLEPPPGGRRKGKER